MRRSALTGRPLTKLLCIPSLALSAPLRSNWTSHVSCGPQLACQPSTHISDESHSAGTDDIEKSLDFAVSLEIRSNALRIGAVLRRQSKVCSTGGASWGTAARSLAVGRRLTLTFRTNKVRQGRSCWTRSSTGLSLFPGNGAGPRSLNRGGLAWSYPAVRRKGGKGVSSPSR